MQKQRVQETNAAIKPSSSSRNMHDNIFELLAGVRPPNQVEDGNFKLSIRFLEHCLGTSSWTNQKKVYMWWKIMKTLTTPLPQIILPLRTFMVKQNFQNWFLDMSPLSPQIASLLEIFSFQPAFASQVLAFEGWVAKPELNNRGKFLPWHHLKRVIVRRNRNTSLGLGWVERNQPQSSS